MICQFHQTLPHPACAGGEIPTQPIAEAEQEVDRFLAEYGLMGGEEAGEYELAAVGGPATKSASAGNENVFTFSKAAPVLQFNSKSSTWRPPPPAAAAHQAFCSLLSPSIACSAAATRVCRSASPGRVVPGPPGRG